MQRQNNVPFLYHPSVFMQLAPHLTPASMAMLVQTCRLAQFRVDQVLHDPAAIVALLGNLSVEQTAQFFRHYRQRISGMVCLTLKENPNHVEANILFHLMCNVTPKVIDQVKLAALIQHIKANKYPLHLIQSLELIAAFLATPKDGLFALFKRARNCYVNLRGANLEEVFLEGCDFSCADLQGANLISARLDNGNFCGANLDETTMTRAKCNYTNFTGASINRIQEEMGWPHEPQMLEARFFSKRHKPAVQQTLHNFHQMQAIPDFLIDAIANDFTRAHNEVSVEEQIDVLESGMTDPLFSTHPPGIFAFWNRYLFTVFTDSQAKIAGQIKAAKLVKQLESEGVEPVRKRERERMPHFYDY